MVDAKKVPLPAPKAISLARECDFLISGRGVKWKKTKLSELNDKDLGKILLGRSGNLKAPTIREKLRKEETLVTDPELREGIFRFRR